MSTAPTTSAGPVAQLIEAILASRTLGDDEKDVFIQKLLAGDFSDEMLGKIQTFLQQEIAEVEGRAQGMNTEIDAFNATADDVLVQTEPEAVDIIEEGEKEMGQVVLEFRSGSETLHRQFNATLEQGTKTKDVASIENLRKMLQQPKQDKP